MRLGAPFNSAGASQAGGEEVADVIRAELQLEAVLGLHERTRHHSRIVDQDVESVVP